MIAALPLVAMLAPSLVIPIPHALARLTGSPDLSMPGAHLPPWAAAAPWICGVYALGGAALLLKLAAARLALSRLWRSARSVEGLNELAALQERFEVTAEVRVTDAAIVPMTWGRRILLPADAREWSPQRHRDVLLHELSHMQRCDSLTQLTAGIVRALFWFSPAVWRAVHRLRVEQEHACDARVLAAGAEAGDYAQTLVDVAAGTRAPSLGMGVFAAMAQQSDLEQRLHAIVTPARRLKRARLLSAAFIATTLASAGFVATAQPRDDAHVLTPLAPMSSPLPPLSDSLAPLPIPGWSSEE